MSTIVVFTEKALATEKGREKQRKTKLLFSVFLCLSLWLKPF